MSDPTATHSEGNREQQRRFRLLLISRTVLVSVLWGLTILFQFRTTHTPISANRIVTYGAILTGYWLITAVGIGFKITAKALPWQVQLQVLADTLMATFLVFASGGVESPFTFLYAVPVFTTAIFFPRRRVFITASLSCLMLGALYVMEHKGILPLAFEGQKHLHPTAERVVYLLVVNFAVFMMVAGLSSSLGEQLHKAGRALKISEDSLEQLAALNRDIVLSLRSGLMAMDQSGCVSLLNPVAEEIIGCDFESVRGRRGVDVFPPLAQFLSDHPSFVRRAEVQYRRTLDQRLIPVGLTLSLLTHTDGGKVGTLVHMQDLTEFKEMEATLERSERMAVLGNMAAGIAHEIRNPLASISGSVQVLRNSLALEQQDKRLLEIVLRETDRLNHLISDFLTFARPHPPKLQNISLDGLIEETLEVFLHRQDGKQLKIRTELAEVKISLDPDQIRQVLWNLLANAADAIAVNGEVLVRLSMAIDVAKEPAAVIEIIDDGTGIEKEQVGKIFDPFYTTKEKGSGLGLAIVSKIIESHGGMITVQSPWRGPTGEDGKGAENLDPWPQGRGSCFRICLPGVGT